MANIYFLVVSVLYILPTSPKPWSATVLTFVFVLLVSMVKELVEDFFRYRADRENNSEPCLVVWDGIVATVTRSEVSV